MGNDRSVAEKALHDQTNILPRTQLIIVFSTLAVTLLICFIDQNGISVALPTIAQDLHAQETISWAGTSSLIANTVFQMIYGRLVGLLGANILRIVVVLVWETDKVADRYFRQENSLYLCHMLARHRRPALQPLPRPCYVLHF